MRQATGVVLCPAVDCGRGARAGSLLRLLVSISLGLGLRTTKMQSQSRPNSESVVFSSRLDPGQSEDNADVAPLPSLPVLDRARALAAACDLVLSRSLLFQKNLVCTTRTHDAVWSSPELTN